MKRDLPIWVSSITGFIVIADFFVKQKGIQQWSSLLQNWGIIVSAFALGVASLNLLRVHVTRVARRSPDWISSVVLLTSLVVMSIIGLTYSPNHKYYTFWYDSVFSVCHSAIGSLLGFYIASSAYRAFRARNVEAAVLLVSAVLVMIGQAPIGEVISKQMPVMQSWMMRVINMAGQRGIMITAGVGAIMASMRVLLGLERGQFGGSGS